MKLHLSLLLFICVLAAACKKDNANPTTNTSSGYNPGAGWNLSWSEEFDGSFLNTSLWNYDIGAGGWGNGELEYYRSENVSVSNGSLVISAKRESYSSSSFTSGRINTKNKYSFKYGKIVGKIKLPEGYGMWPAFWMLGNTSQTWPACGEIDIMEMKGGTDNAYSTTCHWLNSSNAHQYYWQTYTYTNKLSSGYHYYEIEWDSNNIVGRFDGNQFYQMSIAAPEVSELKDNSFFIILNLAVGGNFFYPAITDPAAVTASFPQNMYVDWIRIYQK